MATPQVIIGGFPAGAMVNSTRYNFLMGGASWQSNQFEAQQIFPTAGTFSNFRVKLNQAPGTAASGKKFTFRLRFNATTDYLEVVIEDEDTEGVSTGSQAVTLNQLVAVKAFGTNSPTAGTTASWSVIFTPDVDNQFVLLGSSHTTNLSNSATRYGMVGVSVSTVADEADRLLPFPIAGTLKDLVCHMDGSPGSDGDTYTFTIRLDSVDTNLAVALVDASATEQNTADDVAVSVGQLISIRIVPSGPSPQGFLRGLWGVVFEPTVAGRFPVMGLPGFVLDASATEYNVLGVQLDAVTNSTESQHQGIGQSVSGTTISLFSLCVYLMDPPNGSGKSYTFVPRINGSAGTISVTITDAAQSGVDSGSDLIANFDLLSVEITPANTPDAVNARWGAELGTPAPGTPLHDGNRSGNPELFWFN